MKEKIQKLVNSVYPFPGKKTRGRLVVVSGLADASDAFKEDLVLAISNRKIGPYPIPKGVRFVFLEDKPFKIENFPPSVVLQSIAMAVGQKGGGEIDSILATAKTRSSMIDKQIEDAEKVGDARRIEILKNLKKKSGYVGAGLSGASDVESMKNAQNENGAAALIDSLVSKNRGMSRHDKSSVILDIVAPENSLARKEIATRLLSGILSKEIAEQAIKKYMYMNSGPLGGKPTVEDVLIGVNTTTDVKKEVDAKDALYVSAIANDLASSPVVQRALEDGGERGRKMVEIFSVILEVYPEIAMDVIKKRPAFLADQQKTYDGR